MAFTKVSFFSISHILMSENIFSPSDDLSWTAIARLYSLIWSNYFSTYEGDDFHLPDFPFYFSSPFFPSSRQNYEKLYFNSNLQLILPFITNK